MEKRKEILNDFYTKSCDEDIRHKNKKETNNGNLNVFKIQCSFLLITRLRLAGEEGLEPPTDGFGDRYSTIEPFP